MRVLVSVPLLLALIATGSVASADEPRQVSFERFQLAVDGSDVLGVDAASVPEHLRMSASVWCGFADDPLIAIDDDGATTSASIDQRTGGEILASIGLGDQFAVGLRLPYVLARSTESIDGADPAPRSRRGRGDLWIEVKGRLLFESRHGLDLSVIYAMSVPSDADGGYHGERGIGLHPRLAIARRLGRARLAADAGIVVRDGRTINHVAIDDEVTAAFGASTRFETSMPLELSAAIRLAADAGVPLGQTRNAAAELVGGLTATIDGSTAIFAAAGSALSSGYGTPIWRGLLGIRVSHSLAESASR